MKKVGMQKQALSPDDKHGVLKKLRNADIDQHFGFEEWNDLVVRFIENYRLDDVKGVLGSREYKRIKMPLIIDRRDRGYGSDDPIIEIRILHESALSWPSSIRRDPYGEIKSIRYERLSGNLRVSLGKNGRDQYGIKFEMWEDLTEEYFRELERLIPDAGCVGYVLDAPNNDVEIRRISGRKELISSLVLDNARYLNDVVSKIKERANELIDGLNLGLGDDCP